MAFHDSLSDLQSVIEKKQLLIFDFDGVIADSVHVKTEAYSQMYSHLGKHVSSRVVEFHQANGGVSRYDKFKHWERQFYNRELTKERMEQLCQQFAELVVDKVVQANEIQGSHSFLRKMKKSNKIMAVNSATPELEVLEIVKKRNLITLFQHVLGAPSGKIENIKKILKITGVRPEDSIFFGDALADLRAAEQLTIDFVGVGYEIAPMLKQSNTNCYGIRDFANL